MLQKMRRRYGDHGEGANGEHPAVRTVVRMAGRINRGPATNYATLISATIKPYRFYQSLRRIAARALRLILWRRLGASV